ncbi:hypothetical protein BOTBODRAFT_182515 [Botryobasidium botryosum FD-172 SS1]|uniref:Uncharacterized protein n=1 Tax=Botryobasidium botryosum (strain FD-172 SS1) TaxID=930990 RepID=A0A067LR87_BOTB1|nr:hypothetical protein BOTBODRAFT_182515 [Botryobasidium botryosum FD-172 SS1]
MSSSSTLSDALPPHLPPWFQSIWHDFDENAHVKALCVNPQPFFMKDVDHQLRGIGQSPQWINNVPQGQPAQFGHQANGHAMPQGGASREPCEPIQA